MADSIVAPYGLETNNPVPEIKRYFNLTETPYTSTAQVLSEVLLAVRYKGQTFNVNEEEWWFKEGTADGDLVQKEYISNNIDIVKTVVLVDGYLHSDLFVAVNNLTTFEVLGTESLWLEVLVINAGTITQTRLYKFFNLGKGIYGLGGIQLQVDPSTYIVSCKLIEINGFNPEENPTTQIVDEGWDITGTTISEYVNNLEELVFFQDTNTVGLVVIKVINNGVAEEYLYNGIGGTFGVGEGQTSPSDFNQFNSGVDINESDILYKSGETFNDYKLRVFEGKMLILNSEVELPFTTTDLATEISEGKWNELDYHTKGHFSIESKGVSLMKITQLKSDVNKRSNVFIGYDTGCDYYSVSKMGTDNIAIGTRAMNGDITYPFNCIAIGYESLQNIKQQDSLAIGYRSQRVTTTGNRNVSIGNSTLLVNTTGGFNTTLGFHGLFSLISGSYNVAIGYNSIVNLTEGSRNVAIGFRSGDGLNTTSSGNVVIGDQAGVSNRLLTDNIIIGRSSGSSGDFVNQIVIGTAQTGKGSNTVLIGGSAIIETWLFGIVRINKAIIGDSFYDKLGNPNAHAQIGDLYKQVNVTTSRDFLPTDNGAILKIKANVVLNIPATGLPENFNFVYRKIGAFTLSFTTATGVVLDGNGSEKANSMFRDGNTNDYYIVN